MGNELSHEQGGVRTTSSASGGTTTRQSTVSFGRRGALGLSKSELERRCRPSGLYPSCQWEDKAIRKLIGDGRLAARLRGTDQRKTLSDRECPICFLQYSQINVTQCCRANICTECFLQVRPQKEKHCVCPFCNHTKLYVTVAKTLNSEQIAARQEQEQRMVEATLRSRGVGNGGGEGSSDGDANGETRGTKTTSTTFGSTLQGHQEQKAKLAARKGRFINNDIPATTSRFLNDDDTALIRQISMTEEDRRALEQEMRAQHIHPLALQMEMEAEERRIANEREFYRSQSERGLLSSRGNNISGYGYHGGSSRRMHHGGGGRGMPSRMGSSTRSGRRNWNEIVDSFERGGNGEVNSLDDLVVLEAAMILSMEEEARRRVEQQQQQPGNNAAAAASASAVASGVSGRQDEEIDFDANRHARDGFPLVHDYLNRNNNNTNTARTTSENDWNPSGSSSDPIGNASFRGRVRHGTRGLTEEEQMAMAIALSMQDSAAHVNTTKREADGGGGGANSSSSGGGGSSSSSGSDNDHDDEQDSKPAAAPTPPTPASPTPTPASPTPAADMDTSSSSSSSKETDDDRSQQRQKTKTSHKKKKKRKKKSSRSSSPPRSTTTTTTTSSVDTTTQKQKAQTTTTKKQQHPSLEESFSNMDDVPMPPTRTSSMDTQCFPLPTRTPSLDISFAEDSMAEQMSLPITTLPPTSTSERHVVVLRRGSSTVPSAIAEEGEDDGSGSSDDDMDKNTDRQQIRMLTVDRTPSKVSGDTPDSQHDRKMPARNEPTTLDESDEESDRKMPARPR